MDRIDEIRKRHSERKQKVIRKGPRQVAPAPTYKPSQYPDDPDLSSNKSKGPTAFLFKCLIAAALILGVGIMEKEQAFPYPTVKQTVQTALSTEFNFAGLSNWYETAFGSPLAILPVGKSTTKTTQPSKSSPASVKTTASHTFAVPVTGQVTQNFSQSKKGVTVQTSAHSTVDAIDSGYVLSITNDKTTGKTVVIQHPNGDQSIYGQLGSVAVKQYDFVKKKQKIGTVTNKQSEGVFYFAFKKGNQFVDPVQVISFD